MIHEALNKIKNIFQTKPDDGMFFGVTEITYVDLINKLIYYVDGENSKIISAPHSLQEDDRMKSKEKYMELYEEYVIEAYGDGHISYIHDDYLDGALKFAEWLDKNQSSRRCLEGSAKNE